jgi:hypothetical protein
MKLFKKLFCFLFTKTRSKNKNNLVISNNESINSYDDLYFSYEKRILDQKYGLCPECNQLNTYNNWCKDCYAKKLQQNFGNWTSGNDNIDKFIQESQLNARNPFELLEWIPYNRLRNIKFLAQGGFSTIYEAINLDGMLIKWDYKNQVWVRTPDKLNEQDYEVGCSTEIKNPLNNDEKNGFKVVLKSLDDSSIINEDFLNEVKKLYLIIIIIRNFYI